MYPYICTEYRAILAIDSNCLSFAHFNSQAGANDAAAEMGNLLTEPVVGRLDMGLTAVLQPSFLLQRPRSKERYPRQIVVCYMK